MANGENAEKSPNGTAPERTENDRAPRTAHETAEKGNVMAEVISRHEQIVYRAKSRHK